MDKTAQQRGILNKLREKVNISGRVLEALNREFSHAMDQLRSTDETIREDATDLRPAARNAISDVRRRDYLSAANNIAAFHQRVRYISHELSKFIGSINIKHFDFLLEHLDDDTKKRLLEYNPNFPISEQEEQSIFAANEIIGVSTLVKTADKRDWWWQLTQPIEDVAHNLATQRGIAYRGLEKRFSVAFLKELKKQSEFMAKQTWKMLQTLLAAFKQLAKALARRKLKEYMAIAARLIEDIKKYHDLVIQYFGTTKKGDLSAIGQLRQYVQSQQEKLKQQLPQYQQSPGAQKQIEEAFQPTTTTPKPSAQPHPIIPEQQEQLMYQGKNIQDVLQPEDENLPVDLKKEEVPASGPVQKQKILSLRDRPKSAFINNITKLANENKPQEMLLEILAQSEALEESDSQKSLQLLSIAEGIVEDYKIAGVFDFLKNKKPEEETGEKAGEQEKQPVPFLHSNR